MYWLGCVSGAILVGAIWALTAWYGNRKVQIKEKVTGIINKV
jgi:hypothetical protein